MQQAAVAVADGDDPAMDAVARFRAASERNDIDALTQTLAKTPN
jgi:hypothetical protein